MIPCPAPLQQESSTPLRSPGEVPDSRFYSILPALAAVTQIFRAMQLDNASAQCGRAKGERAAGGRPTRAARGSAVDGLGLQKRDGVMGQGTRWLTT